MTDEPRPLISIVLPAYNEAALLESNLAATFDYLATLEDRYRFEVIVVNDGSADETGEIADRLRRTYSNLVVIHHPVNMGLGRGFRTGFAHADGDYIVTMDIDLSYSPEHIGALIEKIRATHAQMVLASPYMEGGKITNVPWLRRTLSIWANRFLSLFAHGKLSTLTCMTRAYEGRFARRLVLRSQGMDVMPEMIYKSMIMRARIAQIPAHLDWSRQIAVGGRRRSSMRILRHVFGTLLSGFVFRPFMFLVLPGLFLLLFSAWANAWMFVHFFEAYAQLGPVEGDKASLALSIAYQNSPHTFVVGLLSLMLAIQLIGMGMLALQAKNYFEELFYLGQTRLRRDS